MSVSGQEQFNRVIAKGFNLLTQCVLKLSHRKKSKMVNTDRHHFPTPWSRVRDYLYSYGQKWTQQPDARTQSPKCAFSSAATHHQQFRVRLLDKKRVHRVNVKFRTRSGNLWLRLATKYDSRGVHSKALYFKIRLCIRGCDWPSICWSIGNIF